MYHGHIILLRTGGGTVLHTVRGVGGMGIGMLTIDTKTSLYTEDRGLQVPMVLDHDYIPHTNNRHTYHIHSKLWGHTVPLLFKDVSPTKTDHTHKKSKDFSSDNKTHT